MKPILSAAVKNVKNRIKGLKQKHIGKFKAKLEYRDFESRLKLLEPKGFLLVSGAMRSGTTLIGECLYSRFNNHQRHEDICFANDNVLLIRELSNYLRKNISPSILITDPNNRIPFDKKGVSSFCGLSKKSNHLFFKYLLLKKIQENSPSKVNPIISGIKTTQLLGEYYLIKEFFDDVKFIIMMRDPRDVYSSCFLRTMRITSNKDEAKILSLMNTLTQVNSYNFYKKNQADTNIKIVRYEDLVMNTEEKIQEILSFIGVDADKYDWESLNSVSSSNSSYQDREITIGSGVSKESIGKYKCTLSPQDISTIEHLAQKIILDLEYDTLSSLSPKRNIDSIDLDRVRYTAEKYGVSFDGFQT
ncbi:sulfotransferase [Thalassospira xianhensis]|uniref:Sulfotransferase domain-containing protein n=1 Tax=Thalassospira xianhensis MCCC 1A02616 TaxID=1177929 RepID=A0A367UGD3_9PROT|nr:sulfotransferase [Thalassospira xianhensis]RCK07365.1 hypothetical protein TH5_02965 [Thalassospira xianhensis MCCC 1A02616]